MNTLLTGSLLALALGCTCVATAAPLYTITTLGFTDTEHTRTDGYRGSYANSLNEVGQVAGYSQRFNGNTYLGLSAWLYDGTSTFDIGLTDTDHTRTDGYKYSYANSLNEVGQVTGNSYRYSGNTFLGQSAWLYDGTSTFDIGHTGIEHTRTDGYKYISANSLNEVGQVVGYSDRYNGGSTYLGQSAWLYDGTSTITLGLTGPEHTRTDGNKVSLVNSLNEAGQVVGSSVHFNGGSTYLGQSAWLYDGTSTIDIGLTGPEHTRTDGFKSSYALSLNEAGQVTGLSQRYNGNIDLGLSAWLYDGTSTLDIGLADTEHTRTDGYRLNTVNSLNEAGQVAGYSTRYNGNTGLGYSAWLYDGTSTIDIGLTGTEYTRTDGLEGSFAKYLNEAGQVAGYADRFSGYSYLGHSAWLYDGTSTIEIGLTGTEHTGTDGVGNRVASDLNEAGQVAGHSERYNASGQAGQDAWLYDPVLAQTFSMQLSVRSDGYAYSYINYLGDDGLALGYYELFDAFDNSLGNRAFYFTTEDGLHDLGLLVDGGLATNDWEYLADSVRGNGLGQILGNGQTLGTTGGPMGYLMTPIQEPVPEPASIALLGLAGLAGLVAYRRRG